MAVPQRSAGHDYVPAYQISGIPYLTASSVALGAIQHIHFPGITSHLRVKNDSSGSICLAFTENGLKTTTANYHRLFQAEVFDMRLRCTDIYVSGSTVVAGNLNYSLAAALTTIDDTMLIALTGSDGGLLSGIG